MDSAHRAFVDKMYPAFGLAEHPGYCTVSEAGLVLASGGFTPPDKIDIDSLVAAFMPEFVEHIVFHESAHFLHPYGRKFWPAFIQSRERRPERDNDLCEIVAHMGAMVFLNERGGRNAVEKYIRGYEDLKKNKPPRFLIAQELYPHQGLLKQIANADFEEAQSIIAAYTSIALSQV